MSEPVFGHTIVPTLGNRFPRRADGGGAKVPLPNGPCRIGFTWDGPEEAQLYLSSEGAPDRMIGKTAGGGVLDGYIGGETGRCGSAGSRARAESIHDRRGIPRGNRRVPNQHRLVSAVV